MTREELVRERSHRVLIGERGTGVTETLLGAHVGRRPDTQPGSRELRGVDDLRDAEIRDLNVAATIDENVRRLDVAVHDPLIVRVLQGVAELDEEPLDDANGKRGVRSDQGIERRAVHELHDEKQRIAFVADRVDHDDVRMIQLRRRPCLALEPLFHSFVEGEVRQHGLDRHLPVQPQVIREVDGGHTPTSDLFADLVLAGGECR